jgi:integrase
MAERTLAKLEKSARNRAYLDGLNKLYRHISIESRTSLLMELDSKKLAQEITHKSIPLGSSRTLQAFIGQIYRRASHWHGPLGLIADDIQRRCYRLRRQRKAPPYPQIKRISKEKMAKFLAVLEADEHQWRTALAIRLYFATGAKMRRVMSAEWRHILGETWYPYAPQRRRYWFDGRERLDDEANRIVKIIETHHSRLGIVSPFLFPSPSNTDEPIASIWRAWKRFSRKFGWEGLPLSHVVLRYRSRNTPSYLYSHYTFFAPMYERHILNDEIMSKVRNAHDDMEDKSEIYI